MIKYVKPDVTVMEFAVLERLANIDPITLDPVDRNNSSGSIFEALKPSEGHGSRDENLQ